MQQLQQQCQHHCQIQTVAKCNQQQFLQGMSQCSTAMQQQQQALATAAQQQLLQRSSVKCLGEQQQAIE
jgi:hypothetical protein